MQEAVSPWRSSTCRMVAFRYGQLRKMVVVIVVPRGLHAVWLSFGGTTAWTWLWVSPESPQCSDRIDGMRPLLRVSGEPFKTSLQGLVVSLKNLSTVRLMVSLVKPLYKFKTSGMAGGNEFQHSGSSSGAVSCPASTSFGGADTRALTWDKHVQSLGSVTWDVWRSRCGASRGSRHRMALICYKRTIIWYKRNLMLSLNLIVLMKRTITMIWFLLWRLVEEGVSGRWIWDLYGPPDCAREIDVK